MPEEYVFWALVSFYVKIEGREYKNKCYKRSKGSSFSNKYEHEVGNDKE